MPRYYGGYGQSADPREMAQLSGNPWYNPMAPGPDWYGGIMSLYANLKGAKQEKEAKAQAEEDRNWNRMFKEQQLELQKQQIENNKKVANPKGYLLPTATKAQVAQYFGFNKPDEYDQYDPQFQQDMVKEYLDANTAARAKGLKTTPTRAGMAKLKMIEDATGQLSKRADDLQKELYMLLMNPLSDPAERTGVKQRLSNIRRAAMRFSSLAFRMDENGKLDPKSEELITRYLTQPDSIESGVAAIETGQAFDTQSPTPKPTSNEIPPRPGKVKGELATSPTGITFEWDGSKWNKIKK